jgi:hypothetical protein
MIRCRALKLWTAKSEERASQYEDAACYWCSRGRFALSDGVTQSIYAGLWARLLTRCFVRGRHAPGAQLSHILEPGRRAWQEYTNARLPGLPWYAQTKAHQGGYATFLALTLHAAGTIESGGTWRSLAVGDTCLFHVRESAVRLVFPLSEAQQFSNYPAQLTTDAHKMDDACSHALECTGDWLPGDMFWLMTDALALWLIEQTRLDPTVVRTLAEIADARHPLRTFRRMVGTERQHGRLHDDDTTLLAVTMGG